MGTENVATLAASTTYGQYALDQPDGPDIRRGQRLWVLLGGRWIEGHVEHGPLQYVNRGLRYLGDRKPESRTLEGYFFRSTEGDICGLCVGMQIKVSTPA